MALRNLVSFFVIDGPATFNRYLKDSGDMHMYLKRKKEIVVMCIRPETQNINRYH